MPEGYSGAPDADEIKLEDAAFNDEFFTKRLPDDNVQYTLLIIDDKITSVSELRERLKAIQTAAKTLVTEHLKDYIWQRQDFNLSIVHHQSKATDPSSLFRSWYLHGSTDFGDSIADEWLIVWLLRSLSIQFPEAWIQLEDADGQFLLVEAANKLPKWLNPEIADNRVWISNGRLIIIPLADAQLEKSSNITLDQAITYISDRSKDLLHDGSIEEEAFFRLKSYPEAIRSTLHYSLVRIPRRLAYILHQKPAYISPAVEAFYLRDPVSLKPLATKDIGTLHFPPEDFVTVSTRFNRTGYAQVRSQEFKPPPSWTSVIPHMNEEDAVTGLKLTCGFEMLLQDKAHSDTRAVREIQLLLDDLDNGEDTLPSNVEIANWDRSQDDNKWLDIDYEDLDRELRGERSNDSEAGKFGDAAAQENLRKLVDKFQAFMADENAGMDGVEDGVEDDENQSSDSDESGSDEEPQEHKESGENSQSSDPVFEASIREVLNMSATDAEHKDLSNEARRLALEMEDEEEGIRDEDAEAAEVMRLVAKIRAERGAKARAADTAHGKRTFIAGAPPPKSGQKASFKQPQLADLDSDEDWEEGGHDELSSDEDEGENDVDLDLLRNVLGSLSGQQGMGGPAGNLLASMGIRMPRDEELGRKNG